MNTLADKLLYALVVICIVCALIVVPTTTYALIDTMIKTCFMWVCV